MEHTKSPHLSAPTAVLAFALVLAACGGGTSVEGGDVDEPTTAESTAEPVEATSLVGTVWLLDTVYGPSEGPERPVSTVDQGAPAVELIIGPTTATVTSDPCTDAVYEVTFTSAESRGSFEVIGGGSVECRGSEGDNANHDLATGGLVSASGYSIDGGRLILVDEEGELIGFTAQDSAAE